MIIFSVVWKVKSGIWCDTLWVSTPYIDDENRPSNIRLMDRTCDATIRYEYRYLTYMYVDRVLAMTWPINSKYNLFFKVSHDHAVTIKVFYCSEGSALGFSCQFYVYLYPKSPLPCNFFVNIIIKFANDPHKFQAVRYTDFKFGGKVSIGVRIGSVSGEKSSDP